MYLTFSHILALAVVVAEWYCLENPHRSRHRVLYTSNDPQQSDPQQCYISYPMYQYEPGLLEVLLLRHEVR